MSIKHALLRVWLGCSVWLVMPLAQAQYQALPDIAQLVERNAPVVVNVRASRESASPASNLLQMEEQESSPDWLRRFSPDGRKGREPEGETQGSGLIVSSNGYVLTNAHVVSGADHVLVRLQDKREYTARVVGLDRRTDIALLKIPARSLPTALLGEPASVRVGDWAVAIGSPFGFDNTVTAGIVSAKGRSFPEDSLVPYIQTDVAVNPGNSGGPLFNLQGEVIGINAQIISGRNGGFLGLSFAIPIDLAMQVQSQLREHGKVRRGRIGVLIQEVTRDIADSFGLRRASGALVGAMEPGGPAEKAGLAVGDVILRVEGRELGNSNELPRLIAAMRPGSTATLRVWRDRTARDVQVAVVELPEEDVALPGNGEGELRGANRLGLVTVDASIEQRKTLKLDGGASIRRVSGAAARAELKSGDVIVGLVARGEASEIRSADQFNRLLEGLPGGVAVSLKVRRGESTSFVGLRVAEAPVGKP